MSNKTSKNEEMVRLQSIGETVYEKLVLAGSEVREQLQMALNDTNQYQIAIKESSGRILIRIPLNVGLLIALPCLMFRSLRWTVILFAALLFAQAHLAIEAPEGQAETPSAEATTSQPQKHRTGNGTKAKATIQSNR